jgi:hypothetical protein
MNVCQDEWLQKRQINVILSAIQLPTEVQSIPNSAFTNDQLNARRKYEILKRRNLAEGDTNPRLTKAQIWSRLNSVSVEDRIDNKDIPLSRRIPWPEEYYDLSVPLVGFNEPMPLMVTPVQKLIDKDIALYTYSEITHLSKQDTIIWQDSDISTNEARLVEVGYIIIPNNYQFTANKISLKLSVPISLWFYYVHGGEYMTFDGKEIDSSVKKELQSSDKVVMNVASIRVIITFNNREIAIPIPYLQYDLSTLSASNLNPNDNNYVIQHIGTLFVDNLQLPLRANVIYGVSIEVEYSYSIPNAFDVFRTGVLVNAAMSQRSDSTCSQIITSIYPLIDTYRESSFTRIYEPVSYVSFTVTLTYIKLLLQDPQFILLGKDDFLYQTRTCDVGQIIVPYKYRLLTSNIILSIPISLWFYYIIDNNQAKIDQFASIIMTVADIDIHMTYMDENAVVQDYTFASPPIINWSNLQSVVATNLTQSVDNYNNYGIQYIGIIDIANVQLDNVLNRSYYLHLIVTYSYSLPDSISFFKSGVYINPSSSTTVSSSTQLNFLTETETTKYKYGSFA